MTGTAVAKTCPDTCRGTAGGDRLVGNARANTIYAEDRVDGGEGKDPVRGQAVLKGCEIKRPSN